MFVFSVLAEYSLILTITGKIRKRKLREEVSPRKITGITGLPEKVVLFPRMEMFYTDI